jgi:hypothetical protein
MQQSHQESPIIMARVIENITVSTLSIEQSYAYLSMLIKALQEGLDKHLSSAKNLDASQKAVCTTLIQQMAQFQSQAQYIIENNKEKKSTSIKQENMSSEIMRELATKNKESDGSNTKAPSLKDRYSQENHERMGNNPYFQIIGLLKSAMQFSRLISSNDMNAFLNKRENQSLLKQVFRLDNSKDWKNFIDDLSYLPTAYFSHSGFSDSLFSKEASFICQAAKTLNIGLSKTTDEIESYLLKLLKRENSCFAEIVPALLNLYVSLPFEIKRKARIIKHLMDIIYIMMDEQQKAAFLIERKEFYQLAFSMDLSKNLPRRHDKQDDERIFWLNTFNEKFGIQNSKTLVTAQMISVYSSLIYWIDPGETMLTDLLIKSFYNIISRESTERPMELLNAMSHVIATAIAYHSNPEAVPLFLDALKFDQSLIRKYEKLSRYFHLSHLKQINSDQPRKLFEEAMPIISSIEQLLQDKKWDMTYLSGQIIENHRTTLQNAILNYSNEKSIKNILTIFYSLSQSCQESGSDGQSYFSEFEKLFNLIVTYLPSAGSASHRELQKLLQHEKLEKCHDNIKEKIINFLSLHCSVNLPAQAYFLLGLKSEHIEELKDKIIAQENKIAGFQPSGDSPQTLIDQYMSWFKDRVIELCDHMTLPLERQIKVAEEITPIKKDETVLR